MTRVNTLDNGFRYYIRKNNDPKNKVEIQLVVKAGHAQEDKDQVHLAHLIEHMPFSGTEHFDNPITYFEKFGVKSGNDLHANTGWDATSYRLTISSNRDSLLTAGLLFMRDCAQGITFGPKHIDQERHAVIEELRRGLGYETRVYEEYMPKLIRHPKFATSDQVLKSLLSFDRSALIRYYKDWYRPNLQCLIVVGDINVDSVEAKIQSMFASLKNPDHQRKREEFTVPLTGKSQLIRIYEKEFPVISIKVMLKKELTLLRTVGDYKATAVAELYNHMMEKRFARLMNRYNPPIVIAGSRFYIDADWLYNKFDALKTQGEIRADSFKSGFMMLFTELERIKRFGFFEHELTQAKGAFFSNCTLESKTASKNLVYSYMNNFTRQEAAPDPSVEYSLVTQLVNNITLTEINSIVKKWVTDVNRDIVIISGDKHKGVIPNDKTLLNWMSQIKTKKLSPVDNINMIKTLPVVTTGDTSYFSISRNKMLDVTTVRLKNGVTIIFKPFAPTGSNDKILMEAFSLGGGSQNTDNYLLATSAVDIIVNSGVAGLNKFELKDFLADKDMTVTPYIKDFHRGFKGNCSSKEFESMMQLVYAYFTHPNYDKKAFNDWKDTEKNVLKDVLVELGAGRKLTTVEDLEEIDLDNAMGTFKNYFSRGCGFTFIFSGNFEPKKIAKTASLYLGALPGSILECPHDSNMKTANNLSGNYFSKTVHDALTDKASVTLILTKDYNYNGLSNIKLYALERILRIKLRQRLREKEKGVYGVDTFLSYSKIPRGNYKLDIAFDCGPENVNRLIEATMEEIENLKENGPTQEDLQKFVESEKLRIDDNLKDRSFWLKYLIRQYLNDEDPNELLRRNDMLDELSISNLKEAAREYFLTQNCVRLIRFPKKFESD